MIGYVLTHHVSGADMSFFLLVAVIPNASVETKVFYAIVGFLLGLVLPIKRNVNWRLALVGSVLSAALAYGFHTWMLLTSMAPTHRGYEHAERIGALSAVIGFCLGFVVRLSSKSWVHNKSGE